MPFTESLSHAGNFQQSSALWVRNRIKFKSRVSIGVLGYQSSLRTSSSEPYVSNCAFGESFRTVRRQLLPGCSANVALCEVHNGRQSNWPISLKKPPVKINVPSITIKGAANSFLADIWQPDKDNPAKTAYGTVSFRAWFTPDCMSIKAECAAVMLGSIGVE
ncbi:unnamed protein product [Fusarium graminearum]|nr:unnamed protein product [Fusarium graminearum]